MAARCLAEANEKEAQKEAAREKRREKEAASAATAKKKEIDALIKAEQKKIRREASSSKASRRIEEASRRIEEASRLIAERVALPKEAAKKQYGASLAAELERQKASEIFNYDNVIKDQDLTVISEEFLNAIPENSIHVQGIPGGLALEVETLDTAEPIGSALAGACERLNGTNEEYMGVPRTLAYLCSFQDYRINRYLNALEKFQSDEIECNSYYNFPIYVDPTVEKTYTLYKLADGKVIFRYQRFGTGSFFFIDDPIYHHY